MTRKELQIDMEARAKQAEAILGDPAKAEEFKSLTEKIGNIGDQLRAMDKADAEVRAMKEAEANMPAPVEQRATGWRNVANQIRSIVEGPREGRLVLGHDEIRAITSNGAGVNTAPGIVSALVDGGKLRSKVSVFTGPNAQTVVPVFAPHMAVPVGTVQGATGTSSDSTAVLAGKAMTLYPWYSTLAVSMGALNSTDIERYLPEIFSKAFGAAIDKGILVGAGSGQDMLGAFIASAVGVPTASDIAATGTAAAPTWGDYAKLALQLLSLQGDSSSLAITANADLISSILGSTAVGDQPMKQEYLSNRSILGIPVVLSGYGLTTLTSGSYVAVGGYWDHYGLAVAQEITIDKIKTVGSDNIVFQSFMYMQGAPLIGSSFRRLKTG